MPSSFVSCFPVVKESKNPPTSQPLYEPLLKDAILVANASLPSGGTAADSLVQYLKSLDSLDNMVFTGSIPKFLDDQNDTANLYSMRFTLVMTDSKE